MDPETLDRLLVDRSFEALPPDAEALLDAYLEVEPEAAERARCIRETIDVAARSLEEPAGAAPVPPAFHTLRLEAMARARRRWAVVKGAAALAASLVVGVALGAAFFMPGTLPKTAGPVARSPGERPVSAVASVRVTTDGSEGGFWSARRLWAQQRGAARQESARLVWYSPVRWPRPSSGDRP